MNAEDFTLSGWVIARWGDGSLEITTPGTFLVIVAIAVFGTFIRDLVERRK